MKIVFYDEQGEIIVTTAARSTDHWSACEEGHELMRNEIIKGAVDFDVQDGE